MKTQFFAMCIGTMLMVPGFQNTALAQPGGFGGFGQPGFNQPGFNQPGFGFDGGFGQPGWGVQQGPGGWGQGGWGQAVQPGFGGGWGPGFGNWGDQQYEQFYRQHSQSFERWFSQNYGPHFGRFGWGPRGPFIQFQCNNVFQYRSYFEERQRFIAEYYRWYYIEYQRRFRGPQFCGNPYQFYGW